jgi:DNA-binding MarR family transcriptional regulator
LTWKPDRDSFRVNWIGIAVTSSRPKVSALESHLGFWLRFVSNRVSGSFRDRLATEGVSVAEWVCLRELYDAKDMAPSLLAEHIGMTRGGVTKIADRLIRKRLISRRPSEKDGRAQILALTREGLRLVPKLAAMADANDKAFFGHLGVSQRKAIEGAMRDIVRRFGLRALPVE